MEGQQHKAETPATLREALPPLTQGQKVMDVNFNVGQREDIARIKQAFAAAWDVVEDMLHQKLHNLPIEESNNSTNIVRLFALAKTHLETGCMFAVKAVTR